MKKFVVSTLLMGLTLACVVAPAGAASVGSDGAHARVAARLETSAAPSRTAVHLHVRGRHHHRHHVAVASIQRNAHPLPAKPASLPPRSLPHRSTMPVPVSHTRLQHQSSHRGGDPGAVASAVPFACLIGTCPIAGSAVQRLPDRPDVVTSGRGPPRGSPIEASGPIERPDPCHVAPCGSPSCDAVRTAHLHATPAFLFVAVPTPCSRAADALSMRDRAGFTSCALARSARARFVSLCKPAGPCDRSSSVARGRDGVTMHALTGGFPCPA